MIRAYPSRLLLLISTALAAASVGAEATRAEQAVAATKVFSAGVRAQITLTTDWTKRNDIDPPPLPVLAASAEDFVFTDFLAVEDRTAPAVFAIGFSNNPFIGRDAGVVENHIGENLLAGLFYFFFPPRGCLISGSAAMAQARNRQQEELLRLPPKERQTVQLPPIVIRHACEFAPAPMDFFASQISPVVVFRSTRSADRVQGEFRDFYQPPMEQIDVAGKTLFIFEASSKTKLELAVVQRFGLADDRQGATVHFFWAIGARTPFPFLLDPQRKDLELLHASYACLDLADACRARFLALLAQLQYNP